MLTLGKSRSRVWSDVVSYEDAQIDDARFCLSVLQDAARRGAVMANYVRAETLVKQNGRVVGAQLLDLVSGERAQVNAGHVVNAGGPWSPRWHRAKALRLTRGSHVVLRGQAADGEARLFFSVRDGRVMFVLPYQLGTSLVGTTDIDHGASSHEPVPAVEEIRYIRDSFAAVFPEWRHWEPVGWQCGLRPLLQQPGSPSSLSREESIEIGPDGLFSILGGKYTTYRTVSAKVVDLITGSSARRAQSTGEVPILEPDHEDQDGENQTVSARRAFVCEQAVTLEDFFYRRTWLGHGGGVTGDAVAEAAAEWGDRWRLSPRPEEQRFLAGHRVRMAVLDHWQD